MIRSFLLFALALLLPVSAHEPVSVATVRSSLIQRLSHDRFSAAMWGIKVVSLDSGAVLFETNAQKLLKPASNAKLFSGALALDLFGPDYRIRTSIYSERPPANGVVPGDLIIYGRGDPSFAERFTGSYTNLFAPFIATIKRAGIRSVRGSLVGDESYFRGPRFGSGWTWDDLNYYYGAEVSALSIQDNVVDLFLRPSKPGQPATLELAPKTDYLHFLSLPVTTGKDRGTAITVSRDLASRQVRLDGTLSITNKQFVDAVTVPDPALWFVTMLKEALEQEGISVHGDLRTVTWRDNKKRSDLVELGAVESRPMRELVEKMMKPSQNLYAQLLLLQAGARDQNGNASTEDRGVRALHTFLKKAGISSGEVLLEEGSGLSRSCLVTPNAIIRLLQHMARHEHAADFRAALPEPGEGTLRRRLLDLKGKLRAKTGTIRYVNTLSGYINTAAGEPLAFSILLNAYNPRGQSSSSRAEIDAIVRLLASLSEKTR